MIVDFSLWVPSLSLVIIQCGESLPLIEGTRYRFEVERSFPALGSQLALTNAILDIRKYIGLGRRSTIATRLLLGGSFGSDKIALLSGWHRLTARL